MSGRNQRSTYLFVHFNVQPIGHLIVLKNNRKKNIHFPSSPDPIISTSEKPVEGVLFFLLNMKGVKCRSSFLMNTSKPFTPEFLLYFLSFLPLFPFPVHCPVDAGLEKKKRNLIQSELPLTQRTIPFFSYISENDLTTGVTLASDNSFLSKRLQAHNHHSDSSLCLPNLSSSSCQTDKLLPVNGMFN